MRVHAAAFCALLVLCVVKTASGKSLIFNKLGSGSSLDDAQKTDGVNKDSAADGLINSYKRSADDLNFQSRAQRKRSPYGLVYNQGKPIGILEPISQSFEYSAYSNPRENGYRSGLYKSQWYPVKREADLDEEKDETGPQDSSGLHSSNYANVLAKFKVNNKVKQRPYQDFLYSQQVKREASHRRDDVQKRGSFDIGDLSAAAPANTKRSLEKIERIEENLKDVMSDMGLVDDKDDQEMKQKREIYFEDEDLENGLNKIGLTKETTHNDRDKKENCPGKTKAAKSKTGKRQKLAHKKLKKKPEDEPEEHEEEEDDSKRSVNHKHLERKSTFSSAAGGDVKTHVANYQNEGEAYIRNKRQEKDSEKTEDSDVIMKGLEQSGDLTVTGNKSPLVAVTSADDLAEAKKTQEKRDREELEYEKRLERNIQTKIDAIKEEVKREIVGGDQRQRKKRDTTNTLLDEETSALDPGLNIDQKLEPHVRKRRDAQEAKNITKRNQEETNKGKRSDAEVDLSTGKTVVDLGEPKEKIDEAPANLEGEAETSREERNADDNSISDDDSSSAEHSGVKRSLDEYEDTRSVDVDRNAKVVYDQEEANSGRLDRNTKSVLDEDSNVYRQARRRRGARYPKLMTYRAESDGEIDDEGDETDDDGFNDQTSNFLPLNKRAVDSDQDGDGEDEINNEDYPSSYMDRNKRNLDDDGGDGNEKAYDNYLFYPHARRKRGEETALNHLVAIRERNMRPIEKSYRRKRLEKLNKMQNIAELSESDIFGGLPQSYEGELSRFKRVKRQA